MDESGRMGECERGILYEINCWIWKSKQWKCKIYYHYCNQSSSPAYCLHELSRWKRARQEQHETNLSNRVTAQFRVVTAKQNDSKLVREWFQYIDLARGRAKWITIEMASRWERFLRLHIHFPWRNTQLWWIYYFDRVPSLSSSSPAMGICLATAYATQIEIKSNRVSLNSIQFRISRLAACACYCSNEMRVPRKTSRRQWAWLCRNAAAAAAIFNSESIAEIVFEFLSFALASSAPTVCISLNDLCGFLLIHLIEKSACAMFGLLDARCTHVDVAIANAFFSDARRDPCECFSTTSVSHTLHPSFHLSLSFS